MNILTARVLIIWLCWILVKLTRCEFFCQELKTNLNAYRMHQTVLRYSRSFLAVSVILCTCLMICRICLLQISVEFRFFVPWKQNLHLARRAAVCKFCNKDCDFLHMSHDLQNLSLTDFRWVPFFVHRSKTHVWWEKQPDASLATKTLRTGEKVSGESE